MNDNQKIFEMLADAETNAFYAYTHCENVELKEILKENLVSVKKHWKHSQRLQDATIKIPSPQG